jgi:hypothetical protein
MENLFVPVSLRLSSPLRDTKESRENRKGPSHSKYYDSLFYPSVLYLETLRHLEGTGKGNHHAFSYQEISVSLTFRNYLHFLWKPGSMRAPVEPEKQS